MYKLLIIMFLFVLNCTQPVQRTGNQIVYPVTVENFNVNYIAINQIVDIKWNSPDPKPQYYLLLRKAEHDYTFDTTRISGDSIHFVDIPDVVNGNIQYQIVPVKIHWQNQISDTLTGIPSEIKTVWLGRSFTFSINQNNPTTKNRNVKLFFRDLVNKDSLKVVAIRLTQNAFTALAKDTIVSGKRSIKYIPFNYNSPDKIPLAEELTKYTSNGKLNSGFVKTSVPVFDAVDPENSNRSISLVGSDTSVTWVLPEGNGIKRVFVEVKYDNNNTLDTISAEISIAPYKVLVKILNTVGPKDAEMIVGPSLQKDAQAAKTTQYIHTPYMRFSISIEGDATFNSDSSFSYWLAFKKSTSEIDFDDKSATKAVDSISAWIETQPEYGFLTGPGALHDENKEYIYEFDTVSLKGKMHLSSLYQTMKGVSEFRDERAYPFRISGVEHFNEFAVPGKYWGFEPQRLVSGLIVKCGSQMSGTYRDNFNQLITLRQVEVSGAGIKECVLILRFKGKFFNDTRVVFSGSNGYAELRSDDDFVTYKYNRLFLDFIPPVITGISNIDPSYIKNGDTLSSVFNFKLNGPNSAIDKGYCRVSKMDLVISEVPLTYDWTYWTFKDSIPTIKNQPNLSLEFLLSLRHIVIPYEIKTPLNLATDVVWNDIDPTGWRSGRYFIAVATSDEWGNYGLAPKTFAPNETNPLIVTVISGR